MPGCTVVLLPAGMPGFVPAQAARALRGADAIYACPDVPVLTADMLDAKVAADLEELQQRAANADVVVLVTDPASSAVGQLVAAGAELIEPDLPPLLRAVTVMDRLRSPGGCPWDAQQTHQSLRQYLIEETYELLEAIESDSRPDLLEELGDVLLQVLFHARIAAEHDAEPFDIDDVAEELVDKLVSRHPHVFSGGEMIHTAERQQHRWEELKQAEKRRESVVDGVALGQPAAALAAKLAQRTGRAELPEDLFPQGDGAGERIFRLIATVKRAGTDPEGALRAAAKRFAEAVRAAEASARADGADPARLDADGWRRYWPAGG